jgi:hypothetical protein
MAGNDDKFTLDYSKRGHSKNTGSGRQEISRDELLMKNYSGEVSRALNNLVGPSFIGCNNHNFLNIC